MRGGNFVRAGIVFLGASGLVALYVYKTSGSSIPERETMGAMAPPLAPITKSPPRAAAAVSEWPRSQVHIGVPFEPIPPVEEGIDYPAERAGLLGLSTSADAAVFISGAALAPVDLGHHVDADNPFEFGTADLTLDQAFIGLHIDAEDNVPIGRTPTEMIDLGEPLDADL